MKILLITVDTNDGDYIRDIVQIDEEILEHFRPLIDKIKDFKPYSAFSKTGCNWSFRHNFPVGECLRQDLGEKHPMELYDLTEEEYDYFIDAFCLYRNKWGFHTIVSVQEITLGERIL